MSFRGAAIDRLVRILLVTLLAALALLLVRGTALQRIDNLIYDYALTWQANEASEQVVVVAVDDASLNALGRWPWSRRQQAELLDRLTTMRPKAVGFDILFSEPQREDPAADQALVAALARNARSVLAVAPSQSVDGGAITEILPLPDFAAAAAALGHVDIEIDADGLCRSFFTHAGIGDAHWPAFALAVLRVGGVVPSGVAPPERGTVQQGWVRHGRFYVPYAPPPGAIEQISVVQLLSDPKVAERIEGKFVLVGSTATGLGDVVSTPVSFDHQRMPGVELNAHILGGLLNNNIARDLSIGWQTSLTVLFAAAGGVLMVTVGFPLGVLLLFAAIVAIILFSGVLLVGWDLWFAPAAAITPLVASFPLWGVWSLLREKEINQSLTVRMQHQALHHAATDLPNQYSLEQRLRELDLRDMSDGSLAALMIVHISWSESLGGMVSGPTGDELLREIATRLSDAVRGDDLVAHLSGDDFGILIDKLDSAEAAYRIADHLVETIRLPVGLNGAELRLSPRMGMSLWPRDSHDGSALLRDAYIAMFRARVERTVRPCAYSDDIAREVQAQSQLESALSSAMDRGEFEVYYQPQVDRSGNRYIGVEALLRWHNPELGLVYPGSFIPVAEHNGLIQRIGNWVLHTACLQVERWNARGLGPLRLAVNLSPLQFIDGDLLNQVGDALETSGLDPHLLELEITESALMHDMHEAIEIMQGLKRLGVNLALDDFGTGYSSLRHLQHFPLDRIKIDRSFTREIESNPDVREITLTIIAMAKRLKLQIIAEGVEIDAQKLFLGEHGCDELQGFLFSQPLPANELARLLLDGAALSAS